MQGSQQHSTKHWCSPNTKLQFPTDVKSISIVTVSETDAESLVFAQPETRVTKT